MTEQLRYYLNNQIGGDGDVIDVMPAKMPRYGYPASQGLTPVQRTAIENRKTLYGVAAAAKVGDTCKCPSCVKTFTKKSYQQKFCSNKGGGNCKDAYWNSVDPARNTRL